jgi:hypothetical protein
MYSTADTINIFIHSVEIFNISLLIAVLFSWNRLPSNIKWLAIYCFLIVPFLIINYTVGSYFDVNNRFLFHIELHIEFLLFSMFFYKTLTNEKLKQSVLYGVIIFFVCTVVDYLFFESFWLETPDKLFLIFNTWVILLSLSLFYQIYTEGKIKQLFKAPLFWIATALFFQNISSIFINATANLWSYNEDIALLVYLIESLIWFIYVLMLLNFFRLLYKQRNILNEI